MMRPSRLTHGMRSSRVFQARAMRPSGLSIRAASRSAASWSNQWKAWAATTTSTLRVATGTASAEAVTTRRSG